jgi:hypothetical protein
MVRRSTMALAIIGLVAAASTTSAQIARRSSGPNTPGYWVGLSLGYVDGTSMSDDNTGAVWRFGYTSQIRATFEKSLAAGSSIGISAGFSTAPLSYTAGSGLASDCFASCDASADVTQLLAFFHGNTGGEVGLKFFYQAEGGVTEFGNFRERSTDVKLPPSSASNDLTFGFGGGISYGLSSIADVYVGEMWDIVLHHQSTVESQSAPRLSTFRAGFRIGF